MNADQAYLTADEAKDVYSTLGTIAITMSEGAYAQRFVKWALKSCNADLAAAFCAEGFISAADYRSIIEIGKLLESKVLRLIETGFCYTRTETVYEAVLWMYRYVEYQQGCRPTFMFRGQRDSSWPITSTRSRYGDGNTAFFTETLSKFLVSRHPWAFPDQLQAAAQHYGFPTDLIDFSLDPDIAAFFATRNGRAGDRGAIYAVDASSEGEARIVFLSPMFHRIHRQAGLFFEAQEYQSADETVVFEQDSSAGFQVFDADGRVVDPLLDDGPIGLLASALAQGDLPSEPVDFEELGCFDAISALIQEVGCNILRGEVVFNPEMVAYLVISNCDWWTENIGAYIEHCGSRDDDLALARAKMIKEYLGELPPGCDPEVAKILAPHVIWRRSGG